MQQKHIGVAGNSFILQACLFSADLRVSASTESKPLPPEMTFLTKFQLNRNAYVILSLSNCSQKRFQLPHIALKIDSFQGLSAPGPRLGAYSAPNPQLQYGLCPLYPPKHLSIIVSASNFVYRNHACVIITHISSLA